MKKLLFILTMCIVTNALAQDVITFTWEAGTDEKSFEIYFDSPCEEFTVNWGDDSEIDTYYGVSHATTHSSHSYVNADTYIVTIVATSESCRFTSLHCSYSQISNLDVSGCTLLRELYCSGNPLLLNNLNFNNQLEILVANNCAALEILDYSNKQLKYLSLGGCIALEKLDCSNNQIQELHVDACTALEKLDCSNNQIQMLGVNGCTALQYLNCSFNSFSLSDLYSISEMINDENSKLLGTQYIEIINPSIVTGDTLFADQAEFNGIFTNYTVLKNGIPAPEADYTVINGKLIFNTMDVYTVTMTNDAITSNPDYPAKVVVELTILEEPITHIITATAIGDGGGHIEPEGVITVPHGESQTFYVAAALNGSQITYLWIDGENVLPVSMGEYTYTFTNVIADHTIVAEFGNVGINENEYSNLFIYPNPTNGELRITNYELRITNYELQI